jgi:AraC-like DNA-binding protein
MSIFIYTVAYKGLRQPEVIVTQQELNENGEGKLSKSYSKSGLSEEEGNRYLKNLLTIMDEKKPFTNDRLSLSDLADMVGISNHNLSEIINTKIEQNFYDFVNSYRVEEVKRLIKKDVEQKYSILAHGFEAGFSSKSAFYSAFKKFTNLTPAQYRKDYL